jgi:hypothetical protein
MESKEHAKSCLSGSGCIFLTPWGVVLATVCVAVAVCSAALFQAARYKAELAERDRTMAVRVQAQVQAVREDLEEKYRADMVSYEAMSRRVKADQDRTKGLAGNVK